MEDDSKKMHHDSTGAEPGMAHAPHHHHHSSSHGSTSPHAGHSHRHHHLPHSYVEKMPPPPRNINALIILPTIVLLIILSPLFYHQYGQNQSLKRNNEYLWAEVNRLRGINARLMEEAAEKTPPPQAPVKVEEPPAENAPETSSESIVETSSENVPEVPTPKPPAYEPPLAHPPRIPMAQTLTDSRSQAEKTGLSEEDQATLRREIRLAPDGTTLDLSNASEAVRCPDACEPALETAFLALEQGAFEDAAVTLECLVESKPLWPYGRFYLAIAKNEQMEFIKVQKILLDVRLLQAATPEGDLYLILASLFLKDTTTATETLDRLASVPRDYGALPLGPLYIPRDAPDDFVKRLKSLPGLPALQTAAGREPSR